LFYFTQTEYREPETDTRPCLVFLRACDINGFASLDKIYLENGGTEDIYYKRLREKVKFILIECHTSFDNCFCVSMGANTTDNYSMAVRFGEENIQLELKDEQLAGYLDNIGQGNDFKPQFIQENKIKVNVPSVAEMPDWIYNDQMWKQYDHRCIACGRCNTTCVTCSCYTALDVLYDDNCQVGERRRVWASCHIDGFTDMAGGHGFRKENGARMRFKVFHKIYDFNKRFGKHMCVGCGRCDDNCPEYISYSNCINILNDRLKEGEKASV
ncbi:MAG: anaerobic sulfite reductase subunit AsrA, partial [Sedimentisphaerales bacterium]|nr:anaerobic sulfite reductase subunit AsrA [Sedimentisphaerales bacterium]